MPFNPDIIFSFQRASETTPEDWLKIIKKSNNISSFEVPGDFFEHSDFNGFYHEVFKSGKGIVSVKDIIPASLTRNLPSCTEKIKSDIVNTFKGRLKLAAQKNIKFLNIDLGLNSIKSGFEKQEIGLRAQTVQQIMKAASDSGITLLHSFRYPKAFPTCQEWKFLTILLNDVMHNRFRSEINIFPNEAAASKAGGLLKKTYYSAEMIRFIYDPSGGDQLSVNMHDSWKSFFIAQGFSGNITFDPKIKGLEMLKEEFEKLDKAVQNYKSTAD